MAAPGLPAGSDTNAACIVGQHGNVGGGQTRPPSIRRPKICRHRTTTPPSAFLRLAERRNDEGEISQMTDGLPEPGRRFDKTSEKQSAGIIIQLMHN